MKKWYASKTVWFNVLSAVIAVATFYGFTPNQEVFEATTSVLLALNPIINFALRFITKKAIEPSVV